MATDLRTQNALPAVVRITLGAGDVLTQVQLPGWARRVSVQFIDNAGKIAVTGTDAAAIGTAYMTVATNVWFAVELRQGAALVGSVTSVYLASATASTVVEVEVE